MTYINLPFQFSECEIFARRSATLFQERTLLLFDFSTDSLKNCDEAVSHLKTKTPDINGEIFGELLELGVYVGEVMRIHIGGVWIPTSTSALRGNTQMPYVLKLNNGAIVNPIEKPIKRFSDGDHESMASLFDTFESISPANEVVIQKPWWKFW